MNKQILGRNEDTMAEPIITKEKIAEIFCNSGNTLIMGCGGGFDTGSALPIWTHLRRSFGNKQKVFLGGVQEPSIKSFHNHKSIILPDTQNKGKNELKAVCWLEDSTEISSNAPDHPILSVRRCPELCISHVLHAPVLYVSASFKPDHAAEELFALCQEYNIKTILTIDTGIDSHVTADMKGNLGDPEIDLWTRNLLIETSKHGVDCFLANICVGVEPWISKSVYDVFKQSQKENHFVGTWQPTNKDTKDFVTVWKSVRETLGFEPSNTGFALRKALEGFRGNVELPHSPGASVNITDSTSKYYLFRLNSSWPRELLTG